MCAKPWNETPIVETMLRAKNDLAGTQGFKTMLVLTDGVTSRHLPNFTRCLNLFDGQDEAAVAQARAYWKDWNAAGHELIYYQQTERGGWTEKARNTKQGDDDAQG